MQIHDLVKLLQSIGLSEKEAVTYVVSLKIGTSPASIISKHAEFNRCTTYSVLEALKKKKLISQYEKNKVRYFTAADPKDLVSYIEEKRHNLQNCKNALASSLTKLKTVRNQHHIDSQVQSYTGTTEIKKLYHKILTESALSLLCVPAKKNDRLFIPFLLEYMQDHSTVRMIRKKDMKLIKRLITDKEEIKRLPPSIPMEFITPDRVFLMSVSEPFGIEIKNTTITQQAYEQFNILWNT